MEQNYRMEKYITNLEKKKTQRRRNIQLNRKSGKFGKHLAGKISTHSKKCDSHAITSKFPEFFFHW